MSVSKFDIETKVRKNVIQAGYEVEKALRHLAPYPGRPPAIMQAERELLETQRFLARIGAALCHRK